MRRYKTIALYDRLWVQIFKQNSVKAGYFKSHSDALISLHDPNKFSVIGALWDCLKIDGYYEFLMRYPIENEDLHWRQTVNPTHSTIDIGYEKITVNETRAPQFGGLSISKDPQRTLLDGTPTTYPQNWHYSIGAISDLYYPQIPSFYLDNYSDEVQLFLRINSYDDIMKLPMLSPTLIYKEKQKPDCLIFILLIL